MALIDKETIRKEIKRQIRNETTNASYLELGRIQGNNTLAEHLLSFLDTLPEQPEVDLEKVYDSYCKVCGHYHHTTPDFICRQACDYFKDFKALLNAKKEE